MDVGQVGDKVVLIMDREEARLVSYGLSKALPTVLTGTDRRELEGVALAIDHVAMGTPA